MDQKRYCCDLCLSVLPMLSAKGFIVYSLTSLSLIHFELFLCMVLNNFNTCSYFTCSCPVFPASFTEEAVFYPL